MVGRHKTPTSWAPRGSLPPRIEQVNDNSPSRLEMLHFARRIAEQQLTQIDRWIAAEERREAERQHGLAARPPAPDWLIEHGPSGQDSMYVHTGDCWNAGKRSKGVTRDTALRALTEGGAPACPPCRPDTALGILEGLFRRCSAAVHSPSARHALQEGEDAFDLLLGDLDRLGEQFAVSC